MSSPTRKTAVVFSHAHWDIEWYMPFRSYRFWLLDLLDSLLEICDSWPEFRVFVLDGQVAPLEHYLAVRPENEASIRELVRSGRLAIGPFYTQFDEWLVSPESMVRNCLWGARLGREYGGLMRAGYLPDNFGHPRQMPQILAGFGLDSLIFMRGMPDRPQGMRDEFLWEGPDGTRVLAIHLSDTYCNAAGVGHGPLRAPSPFQVSPFGDWQFGYDALVEQSRVTEPEAGARRLVEQVRASLELHPSGVVPLANGQDHSPPQAGIGEVIRRANELAPDIEIVHADCAELVLRVRGSGVELPVLRGELWGAAFQYILTGTLSTRSWIKQANFAAEALLEIYAEPLAALASLHGASYPSTLLEEAWRLLLTNHAHDGIHGSSADAVHVEMHQRFLGVRQIAVGVCHASLARLGASLDRARLVAYNPVDSGPGPSPLEAWVDGDVGSIVSPDGSALPTQVPDDPLLRPDGGSPPTGMPWPHEGARHILFLAPVPASGLRGFAVARSTEKWPSLEATDCSIENELLRARFVDGAFEIQDKVCGAVYQGVGVIEEEPDAGDAWDYSPLRGEIEVLRSDRFRPACRLVEAGPVRATLEAALQMQVPACLEGERRSARTVALPVKVRLSLWRGLGRADLTIELENTARDHRMRLRCPTGIRSDTVASQGHFALIERPLDSPWSGEGWRQPPPRTHHFREWVGVEEEGRALALACRGMHEYEAVRGESGVLLYVTLLRGIGCMGRRDLASRAGAASPPVPTPDAQCTGPQRFELALIPCSGSREARHAAISRAAAGFLYPVMVHALYEESGGGAPDLDRPLYTLEPGNLRVSACKRAEDGEGFILRFWENEGIATAATLALSPRFGRAILSGLDEQPIRELPLSGGRLRIDVAPYRIVTLRLLKGKPC